MLVVYHKATQRVFQILDVYPENYVGFISESQPELGCVKMDGGSFNPDTIGIKVDGNDAAIIERVLFPFVLPVSIRVGDTITLNVPTGTSILTESGTFVMDDSQELLLSFDQPGSYRVRFDHPHYLVMEAEIAAHLE